MSLGTLAEVVGVLAGIVALIALVGYLSGGYGKLRAYLAARQQERVMWERRVAKLEEDVRVLTGRLDSQQREIAAVRGEQKEYSNVVAEICKVTDSLTENVRTLVRNDLETSDQVADLRASRDILFGMGEWDTRNLTLDKEWLSSVFQYTPGLKAEFDALANQPDRLWFDMWCRFRDEARSDLEEYHRRLGVPDPQTASKDDEC